MIIDETMDTLRSAFDRAAQKTADAVNRSGAHVQLAKLRSRLNELYRLLGKAEYDAAINGVSSMDEINSLIAEITELRDRYAEINAGIQGGNLPFCPNCGRENASGDAFCAGCGTRLSK
ncbi:MAG: zinc ribbon domain-containing protein [Oscillospiraceae bacterium]|nr:zinc ribbon domain-containing protein [Oscillospiraceae bacterium]